tara:strand:- start:14098 stop:16698 length:2601 start_codon:yes stop_codon:yes gene_type:complete
MASNEQLLQQIAALIGEMQQERSERLEREKQERRADMAAAGNVGPGLRGGIRDLRASKEEVEKTIDKINQAQQDLAALTRAEANANNENISKINYQLQLSQQKLSAINNIVSVYSQFRDALQQSIEIASQGTSVDRQKLSNLQAELDSVNSIISSLRTEAAEHQRINSILGQRQGEMRNIQSLTSSWISTLSGGMIAADAADRSLFGAVFGSSSGATFSQKLSIIGATIRDNATAVNIAVGSFSSLTNSLLGLIAQQERAASEFAKATGASRSYNTVINETVVRNTKFAATMQEGYQNASILYNSMSKFSQITAAASGQVQSFAIQQDRLGVSVKTTASSIDMLTRTFGMSIQQAMDAQSKITVFARQIGVSEQTAMSNFVQFAGSLSAHGPNMINVFKHLQEQAKNTGVAMGSLLQVASKFDTFEGAANAVGKLNAILGGNYLNSVQMVAATEGQRIQMLARSVQMSGQQVDSMGRFQRMAIAQAMGVRDVEQAMRMLRAELGQKTAADMRAAEAQRLNEQRARDNLTIMDRLRTIAMALTRALMPMVDWFDRNRESIGRLIDRVVNFIQRHGKLIMTVKLAIPALSAAAGAFNLLGGAIGGLAGPLRLLSFGGIIYGATQLVNLFTKPNSPILYQAIDSTARAINKMSSASSLGTTGVGRFASETGKLVGVTRGADGAVSSTALSLSRVGGAASSAAAGMGVFASVAGSVTSDRLKDMSRTVGSISYGVGGLSSAINDLDTTKLAGVATGAQNLRRSLAAPPDQREAMQETSVGMQRALSVGVQASQTAGAVNGMERLAQAAANFSLVQKTSVMAASRAPVVVQAPRPAGSGGPIVVHLEVDGQRMASKVIDVMNMDVGHSDAR